jgi:quercetin dioxygenase-like cupin family protein
MFLKLSDRPEKEPVPGYKVRFVHGEHMTLAYWRIEAGAVLSPHSHPHEQVSSVIEGKLELTIEGETRILGPGSVGVIAPNARHAARAITDCRVIDAFYPVREDYRDS